MSAAHPSSILLVLVLVGCGQTPAEPNGAPSDAGARVVDARAPACFTNPTTYLEIINACTDAQAVDKQVDLSVMNLPGGGLQPLP